MPVDFCFALLDLVDVLGWGVVLGCRRMYIQGYKCASARSMCAVLRGDWRMLQNVKGWDSGQK